MISHKAWGVSLVIGWILLIAFSHVRADPATAQIGEKELGAPWCISKASLSTQSTSFECEFHYDQW